MANHKSLDLNMCKCPAGNLYSFGNIDEDHIY